jgi:RHH-type transcriptional regulator, rel operon repressor / antitoxin RelB
MFTVRLSPALESRLTKLSRRTGRPKSYYAKRAIAEFLDDQEDYLIAISRLEDELPPVSLSKVIKRLGLDH